MMFETQVKVMNLLFSVGNSSDTPASFVSRDVVKPPHTNNPRCVIYNKCTGRYSKIQ